MGSALIRAFLIHNDPHSIPHHLPLFEREHR
jgi:hypothetical protein